MPKWYGQFNPPPAGVASDPGDPVHIEYQGRYDEHGDLYLAEVGKSYIPDLIQSHAESCDINVILSRYANGDADALSQRQGVFVDAVNLPHSYADLLNTVLDAQAAFDALPIATKEKFGNNFASWISEMDNMAAFAEKMGITKPQAVKVVDQVKEVKSDA